ncbi:hypothetical protein STCU_11539 [Strigomonas culicis]|uniref:Uncharacterized protein n=1 Tax=Strigomonas culicis TaxID=28005 RepID=S9TDP2_9TRYP|nr:hypothetical protein STCU_11539 [Strigomonas culicis]|eukprot:EPY16117.1 hypothetical protein STCU_11539 [Strigomonas culicis]
MNPNTPSLLFIQYPLACECVPFPYQLVFSLSLSFRVRWTAMARAVRAALVLPRDPLPPSLPSPPFILPFSPLSAPSHLLLPPPKPTLQISLALTLSPFSHRLSPAHQSRRPPRSPPQRPPTPPVTIAAATDKR